MINRRNLYPMQHLGPLLRIYFFKTKCTKGITISWVSLYQTKKHLVRASNNIFSFFEYSHSQKSDIFKTKGNWGFIFQADMICNQGNVSKLTFGTEYEFSNEYWMNSVTSSISWKKIYNWTKCFLIEDMFQCKQEWVLHHIIEAYA